MSPRAALLRNSEPLGLLRAVSRRFKADSDEDAGSGDAYGRTSEIRGNPQRVGFKQVRSTPDVENTPANRLVTTKTAPTREELLDELNMQTIVIPSHLHDAIWFREKRVHGKDGGSRHPAESR